MRQLILERSLGSKETGTLDAYPAFFNRLPNDDVGNARGQIPSSGVPVILSSGWLSSRLNGPDSLR